MNNQEIDIGIIGKMAWGAARIHGSLISFEFGQPRLEVREPVAGSQSPQLRRRKVSVVGDWQLMIEADDWSIHKNQESICSSNDNWQCIEDNIDQINGLHLMRILIDRMRMQSIIEFESNFFILFPIKKDIENETLWSIFDPGIFVYECDARGFFHKLNRFDSI